MSAMLKQISPQSAVTNFEDIAAASSEMISTNLPASELDRFMQLALKARSQRISTVSLVPPLINTGVPGHRPGPGHDRRGHRPGRGRTPPADDRPGGARARAGRLGDEGAAPAAPATKKAKAKGPTPVTGGSVGSLADGYAANQADDLASTC